MRNHRLHKNLIKHANKIKSVEENLIINIPESLRESLMQVAYKLLISDNSNFDKLTPSEQKLWNQFKTKDIYRFLTGIMEFQYNWFTV